MKLSRTTVYALQAILQLAQADVKGPVPCSRLAADGGMPERFLLQILRSLVTHGILSSTRGIEGGYTLQQGLADISLLDVMEAVGGPFNSAPPIHEGLPQQARSKLECAMREVAETAQCRLRAVKLTDLLPAMDPSEEAVVY